MAQVVLYKGDQPTTLTHIFRYAFLCQRYEDPDKKVLEPKVEDAALLDMFDAFLGVMHTSSTREHRVVENAMPYYVRVDHSDRVDANEYKHSEFGFSNSRNVRVLVLDRVTFPTIKPGLYRSTVRLKSKYGFWKEKPAAGGGDNMYVNWTNAQCELVMDLKEWAGVYEVKLEVVPTFVQLVRSVVKEFRDTFEC